MDKKQKLGSKTAKQGFQNEKDIVSKFNNWKTDSNAKIWLEIMNYNLDEIEYVEAVVLSGYKADVQVQVTIKLKTINVSHLEAMLPTLVKRGKAAHKEGIYEVDLSILGYDKLLGQGEILTPVKIKVEYATEAAIDKVKAVGGEVILLSE